MTKTEANKTARRLTAAQHYGISLCQSWETGDWIVRSYNACGSARSYELWSDVQDDIEADVL
jgi:hypothetical protein